MNQRMKEKEFFMGEALKLAKKGMGFVGANPMVGALLVKNGKILGSGFHQKFGGPHAEVNAVNDALVRGHDLKGATLFCTLEPCSHTNKKTPPCAQMLLSLELEKVVIATLDPNPEVSGRGVAILRQAGIDVEVGIQSFDAQQLNKRFFHHIKSKRPFVAVKWAQTLDGYVALQNGESKYISSLESRIDVHHDRQLFENILIGGKTLRKDNPKLDCRNFNIHYQPNRFILADLEKFDHLDFEVFQDQFREKTYLLTKKCQSSKTLAWKNALIDLKVNVVEHEEDHTLKEIFNQLYKMNFASFYVEAGSALFHSLKTQDLIDEIIVYLAPKFFFGGVKVGKDENYLSLDEALSASGNWQLEENTQIGNDVKLVYQKA